MHKQTIYLYEHDQAFRMGHEHQKDKLSQLSVLTRTSSLTHETPPRRFPLAFQEHKVTLWLGFQICSQQHTCI